MHNDSQNEAEKQENGTAGKLLASSGLAAWLALAGVIITGGISLIGTRSSEHTQNIVQSSAHVEAFEKTFNENIDNITSFLETCPQDAGKTETTSAVAFEARKKEAKSDITLTALYDFAQTYEDKVAMLTIAARLLHSTDCGVNGESTARFLDVLLQDIKNNPTHDNIELLKFMRSQSFLNLASSDIRSVYFNDDRFYSDPKIIRKRSGNNGKQVVIAVHQNPEPDDERADLTFWGEQSSWNESKNELFHDLRPDDYIGWIHVATWEIADSCIDENFQLRPGVKCVPLHVQYTSSRFSFKDGDHDNLKQHFWLGRSSFLRNAPPRLYFHDHDIGFKKNRGVLGAIIGVINYGECVQPLSDPQYYHVTTDDRRNFIHVWIQVRDGKNGCPSRESRD